MQPSANYELLIDKINEFIRRYYLNNLLRGLIFLGAGLFSAYIIITVGEYYGNFSVALRTFLFYAFILLNIGLLCWLVIPSLLAWLHVGKTLTHDEAAQIIGKHFSNVSDKLLNTLQLKQQAEHSPGSRQLIEASINQKIENLKPVSFPSAVNLKENSKYLKWILPPAAIICILALAAPSVLTESTRRLIRHNEYFAPVAPFQFVLLNQNLSAVQGGDLKIDLNLTGNKLPADVYLETNGNTFKLDKESLTRFHYQFTNLQQSTNFRITANGYNSQPYQIKVNLKPSILNFDVSLAYPAYLHKKNETIANAGDLTVPAGTMATWQLHTQNASALQFALNNRATTLTNNNNGIFEYSARIISNGNYTLRPQSKQVSNGDVANYRINVITDEAPSISVEEKADSVSSKAIYFNGRIQDDHGFSSLTFHYYTGQANGKAKAGTAKSVKADLGQTSSDFFYYWDMKDLDVKPGQEVFYYFDVADNDAVNGAKHTRSPVRSLKNPTEKELNNQLNAGTQAVKQKMVSAIKLAGQLDKDAQKLNQLLVNKNTLSFDEKKQVEDLLQKRRDLNDLIKDIQTENQKNMYNRQENKQQDEALTEKQRQMENLLKNMMDPETQQLLEKLQKLMEADQKEPTRDAVNQMQADSRNLKKELDRMRELYKKLEVEQKLDEVVNTLNKLADKQDALSAKTQQQQNSQQQLQQEQQGLNQEFKSAEKAMDELKKANEQLENKMNLENPEQQKQSIEQEMNESSEGIKQNNRQKAAQSQKQAAGKMRQMAKKMQQSSDESEESQNSIDMEQLRGLLKNLVNSSFEQEKIMQNLKSTYVTDPNYTALAQKQKDIKDNLKTAEDTLYALSRRIPQIQSTVNTEISGINSHIDQALENMGDRKTAEANSHQQYAMTGMNNLALMLSDALDHLQDMMKNGKSGKGKQKQSVQQLSRMQQQLNQNMQKMREQMQKQGNKMSESQHQSQSEQLARMARAQQEIRQQLQQIDQQDNKDGRNSMGKLSEIAKQMEQTESDLVNRKITDESIKRQQQIQVKLLEAEKAEREREQDQQRESKAGKDMPPGYIKALQNYQQTRAKQTEQIKTVPTALNLYYKEKIKSYFNQLNAK